MALVLDCGSPPPAYIGQPYSVTLVASGGTPPYTYSITSGALPGGLSLNAATGVISGLPAVPGTFGYRASVTDSGGAAPGVEVNIGTTVKGYDFSANPGGSGSVGFEYLGNEYQFLNQGGGSTPSGDFKVHAFKSTDLGATWAEQDSAGAPSIGDVNTFGSAYTICRDGATVYLVWVRATFVGGNNPVTIDGLTVQTFDLASGTWAGSSTDYAAPVVDTMRFGTSGGQSRQVQISLILRGAGDMILYYSGPNETNGLGFQVARRYYATFDGSTFGPGVQLPDQTGSNDYFFGMGAVCDSDGVTHFFYLGDTFPAPSQLGFSVFHVSMSAGGAFGATELITDGGYLVGTTGTSSSPIVFTSAGVEYVAFALLVNDDLAFTTQSQRVFYAATVGGTGALAWLNSIISQAVYGDNNPALLVWQSFYLEALSITLAYDNGTLVCAWAFTDSDTALGYYYESHTIFDALAWSAPAVLATVSIDFYSAYQINSWPMTGRIGFAFASVSDQFATNDAEVGQFNTLSVSGSATADCSIGVSPPLNPNTAVGGMGCTPHCYAPPDPSDIAQLASGGMGGDPFMASLVAAAVIVLQGGER